MSLWRKIFPKKETKYIEVIKSSFISRSTGEKTVRDTLLFELYENNKLKKVYVTHKGSHDDFSYNTYMSVDAYLKDKTLVPIETRPA
tara:strand:- start:7899 stop:8159 length:261 start_codon:yes stop_codon:yes gene_type:complete